MTAMSVSQVAERMGCSRDAVYDMIHAGTLPHFRIGSVRYRVLASVVEAHMRGQSWASGVGTQSASTVSGSSKVEPSPSGERMEKSTGSDSTPQPRPRGARRSIDTLAAGRY